MLIVVLSLSVYTCTEEVREGGRGEKEREREREREREGEREREREVKEGLNKTPLCNVI